MLNTTGVDVNFYKFSADVVTHNEYYPFGMLVPNRHASSSAYRYGFQGQEKDDELKGEGNSLNYKFRMHDPRVGRFFAVDPLASKYPFFSPYSFGANRVIDRIELEGLESKKTNDKEVSPFDYFGLLFKAQMDSHFGFGTESINKLNQKAIDNQDANMIEISNDLYDHNVSQANKRNEALEGVTLLTGGMLLVGYTAPVAIAYAPAISPAAASYIEQAIGKAGVDALNQAIVKGDITEVDWADAVSSGVIKNSFLKTFAKSFVDFKNGKLSISEFKEGMLGFGFNVAFKAAIEKVPGMKGSEDLIKDMSIKLSEKAIKRIVKDVAVDALDYTPKKLSSKKGVNSVETKEVKVDKTRTKRSVSPRYH